MDLFQFVVAVLTIAGPIIGGVGYWIKKSGDAKLDQVKMQVKAADEKAKLDLEQVRSESAQALAASKSIEALTSAIVTQVEDRRESTAATKENTAALKDVKVSIQDWDSRQALFFRDFPNHITAFSTEAVKAIKSLETVVENAILGLNNQIGSAIPQMVSQVTPLVDKITTLVDEIIKAKAVDETNGGKLGNIEVMLGQLVVSMIQLQKTVELALKVNTEASHEKPSDGSGDSAGAAVAAAVVPAGDGPGGGGELQPA